MKSTDQSAAVMSAPPASKKSKQTVDHLFVSNIRFWSILCVVWVHSAAAVDVKLEGPFALSVLIQIAKFATIGFFTISGFLLGDRIQVSGRVSYFKRRMSRIVPPWCLWVCLYCGIHLAGYTILNHALPGWAHTFQTFGVTVLLTSYWFVPNMVVALAVMLLFARYIESWAFGGILFALSGFYAVNIYGYWLPSAHTEAALGFVSYLWLGAWCSRNWDKAQRFLSRFSVPVLAVAAVVTWFACMAESHLLRVLHNQDSLNTLRITNQLYSIVCVMLLLKLNRPTWPKFVKPRQHIFGIYLTHSVVLEVVSRVILRKYILAQETSQLQLCLMFAAVFALSYAGSLVLTLLLEKFNFSKWTVGAVAAKTQPASLKALTLTPDSGD